MSLTPPLCASENGGNEEHSVLDFDCHYRLAGGSVRDVLTQILEDMSTHNSVHNWDEKLVVRPLKTLATMLRSHLAGNPVNLDPLLVYSNIDEILTVDGVDSKYPAIQEPSNIDLQLFFTTVCISLDEQKNQKLRDIHQNLSGASVDVSRSGRFRQGRIVYLDGHATQLDRALLLVLFVFSVRLQDEDKGYLNAFIERHLALRSFLQVPSRWQEMSPPELDASRQISYRRVSSSLHITYLMLETLNEPTSHGSMIDRTRLFPVFRKKDSQAANSEPLYLSKSSSSVLLTLAIPEVSATREEYLDLLKNSDSLWTVIIVNCSMSAMADGEKSHYLTPIAQYIRLITSALRMQRTHAEAIYILLEDQIRNCNSDSLFDDEDFSLSMLYHWTIKMCDELRESVASTLRFMKRAWNKQLREVSENAHPEEKPGLQFWTTQMDDEIFALEELQTQVIALNSRVQESRNALHGVTAVLQARLALQQGERTKTLAYLATLYLPLTATASLYSMSVLPASATFPSFFIVLAVFLLITISIGLYLSTFLANVLPSITRPFYKLLSYSNQRQRLCVPFLIQKYIDLLDPKPVFKFDFTKQRGSPQRHNKRGWLNWLLHCLLRGLDYPFRKGPADLVHYKLIRELFLFRDLYVMSQYLGNRFAGIEWHWTYFAMHVVRAILLPVWLVMVVGIVAWLIVLDLVLLAFEAVFWLVARIYNSVLDWM
ncbi:hypothetical protein K491DRAFT_654142 [Lophiostoma macrostomum CBS 122681]|uniref:Uncharacterized protein n=1 Tax=Lophiostoma macrostomum CBS 122681 TaxID=1314788 RepID=A0A6A6TDC4_9PLEO|nr:hypothetical protein K491DRAFT_654142 [Lophiostoma macrostomum CBS 122681]